MYLLEALIINSLFIIGLYEASEHQPLLAKISNWLEAHLAWWLYAPVLGCVYCMASIWGTIFFALNLYLKAKGTWQAVEILQFWYLPFYMGALSGLTYLLYDFLLYCRGK